MLRMSSSCQATWHPHSWVSLFHVSIQGTGRGSMTLHAFIYFIYLCFQLPEDIWVCIAFDSHVLCNQSTRVMTTNELFTFRILLWGRAFWAMSLVSNAHAENIHCTVLSTPRLSPYSLTCSLPVLQLHSQTPPPPAREQNIERRAALSRWRLDSKPSSWNTKPTPWVQPVPSRTTHLP